MTLTVGLLPWLPLVHRVSFAEYEFDALSQVSGALDPDVAAAVRAIASTFADTFAETDPILMWPSSEGETPTFGEPDIESAQTAARLLATVALVSNEYFSPASQPVTATNFILIFQRFQPGSDFFSIVSRRREGQTLSGGHTFSDSRFTRPTSAPSSATVSLPPSLLNAVAPTVRGESASSVRIRQSALPFVFANRLDEFTSIEAELFWVATALEQLLAVSERPKRQGITAAFVERVTNHLIADEESWARRAMTSAWARELYGQRSEVHGAPHGDRRWDAAWHVFLATEAYGIVLRQRLVAEGSYATSESDEVARLAFPRRLARFRQRRLESGAEVWKNTGRSAEGKRRRLRIVEHLQRMNEDGVGK